MAKKRRKQQYNEDPMQWLKSIFLPAGGSGGRGKIPKRAHFSIWYFLIVFSSLILFQNLFLKPHIRTISYSEFKRLLGDGKVDQLVIEPQIIRGSLKTPEGDRLQVSHFLTYRVEDPDLVKELDAKGVEYRGSYESKWLSNLLSWVVPIVFFFVIWGFLLKRMNPGVMSFGKSKAKLFAEEEVKVTFDDVAGIDEAKAELEEVVEFLKTPKKFQRLGGKIPKGVLLVGPPGTGKTLLARAVAGEAKVPFFNMSGSGFVEMFVGVGAARVRDLFKQAKSHAPCIIFIDELDALGKARGINPTGGHDEREQTLNQLLVEMDGFDRNTGVIIMAATNRPEILDPALMRPGRFDRHVVIDRPDIKGRVAILKVHTADVKLADDVDLEEIAARTPGFVGADLANLVNEAALLASRKDKEAIEKSDFDEAIDRLIMGLEKKGQVISKKEKEIVAYHEAGHALVAESLKGAPPVLKISIIPRGIAALGYTQPLMSEEKLHRRSEIVDEITTLLGGRAAEEIVFDDISTGAANDLHKATDKSRRMVAEWGMSERIGLTTYQHEKRGSYLDIYAPAVKEYSEQKAREIDEEVHRIIEEAHTKAKEILTERRELLDRLATLLLEKEVIEGKELREMLKEAGYQVFHREEQKSAGAASSSPVSTT